MVRDHNQEYQDSDARKYAYDFDGVVRRYLLKAVARHFSLGGTALELGCYRGDMTEQILAWFPRVTVVEASSDLAQVVRGRFAARVDVITSTFEEAKLPTSYDNVFLVHTLEHLDEPIAVLERIRGWLSPAGRLFVAVPNANALSRQIAVKMGLVEFGAAVTPAEAAHGHRRTYSMDVLLSHLRRAGLRIVDYGGVVLKPLANFQFDRALSEGIVSEAYLDACDELARTYPDLSASVFAVAAAS